MRDERRGAKQDVMKSTRKPSSTPGDLRAEYAFDYQKARPNRFASRQASGTVAIVLEPDVARVFGSSREVNRLLRSVIRAVPRAGGAEVKRRAG